jgi:tetratricopeptide (TPR) repeat protein
MKIKPIYIYLGLIIVALITIITISTSNDSSKIDDVANMENIPNDEVHKSLENQTNMNPSGSNVTSSIKNKINELEEYVTSNPKDTTKIKEYADLLAGAHNEEKALKLYHRILKIDNKRTDVLSIVSRMYFKQSEFKEAKLYIEKIIEIDPANTEAIYNLGVVEIRIGDMDAAKKQWKDLITNHPNTKMSTMAKESLERLGKTDMEKK